MLTEIPNKEVQQQEHQSTWLQRLHEIQSKQQQQEQQHHHRHHQQHQNNENNFQFLLRPLFIGGTRKTKELILNNLRQRYSWIDISNISLQLLNVQYKNNIKLVLNHMYNGRNEPKIYDTSDPEVKLYFQILTNYYQGYESNKSSMEETVRQVYTECRHSLNEPSTAHIILTIDYRLETIAQQKSRREQYQLFLEIASYAAIMSKRHLYPFIEFIVICDPENCQTKNENYDSKTYKYVKKLVTDALQPQIDTVLYTLDFTRINNTIVVIYRSAKEQSGNF